MGEEICFTASDQLAEWLRAEADQRALTVADTVEELLTEKYDEESSDVESATSTVEDDPTTTDEDLAALADEVKGQEVQEDALDRNPTVWTVEHRNDVKYYVVELPDGETSDHTERESAANEVAAVYE